MYKFAAGMAIGMATIEIIFLFFIVPDIVLRKTVIEAGHGEYNRTTGEFQFLPACNKVTK